MYNETAEQLKSLFFKNDFSFYFSSCFDIEIELIHNDPDQNSAQRRIKESQLFVLSRRLRDIMMEYNRETVTHRDRCKKVIVEQLRLGNFYENITFQFNSLVELIF